METNTNDDVMDMFEGIAWWTFDCSVTQFSQLWPDGLFGFMIMANGKFLD